MGRFMDDQEIEGHAVQQRETEVDRLRHRVGDLAARVAQLEELLRLYPPRPA